ncbi:TIR domain-containing protein [Luteolibacter rhizosphaerae]|uniref:TIR domain-containing protein n=1 Tax=Luteolibacter rhizosphaerae TaxID=2989719 RepID=UPI0031F3131D
MSNRRHLFISHHHADDASVDALVKLVSKKGYDVRNSSIRAKPANQDRLARGLVDPAVIKRLLRMKISWASTVVVLIGKETHKRSWVNWEITTAHEQGKRIVGVFERGGTQADVPPAFEDCAAALVNWNSDSILNAIDGSENVFESPEGGLRPPVNEGGHSEC